MRNIAVKNKAIGSADFCSFSGLLRVLGLIPCCRASDHKQAVFATGWPTGACRRHDGAWFLWPDLDGSHPGPDVVAARCAACCCAMSLRYKCMPRRRWWFVTADWIFLSKSRFQCRARGCGMGDILLL